MTITVARKDEGPLGWSDVDSAAVQRMIAAADAEGAEYSLGEVAQRLHAAIDAARRN
jgi:hypothetical protein